MKKILGFILAFILLIGVVGCTEVITDTTIADTTTEETTDTSETTEESTVLDQDPVFEGVSDKEIYLGEEIDFLAGITVTDEEDGDLTSEILVDSDEFDNTTEGDYTITLTVTDSADNTVTETYTISVVVNPNKELADADLVDLEISLADLLAGDGFPSSSENGTTFYYKSLNTKIISNKGFVNRPPVSSDPVEVTISVRAKNGSYITPVPREITLLVEPYPEVSVTSKRNVAFEGTSEEYVVDQAAVDLYYVDEGELPYIDIETFFNLMDGAIEADILTYTMIESDIMEIEYSYTYTDYDDQEVTDIYTATIDFTENTLTVSNFDFFAGYIASTESDYGEGLNYVDADYVDGEEVTIPLGMYNFDLVIHNDAGNMQYLMPLAVANIIFMNDVYYQAYYNGDKIWGVDTFALSAGDEEIINQIHDSSYNEEDMTKDVRLATYNALALVMDYFYGLKPDKGYETFYDIISASMESMITGTDNYIYNKIFDYMYGMDDLHTSHVFYGFYDTRTTSGLSISDLGPQTVAFYEGLWDMQDALEAKYGGYSDDDIPDRTLLADDTVAIIHITGFTIDTPDEFKAILDALPATVEDVVIDLSYNTGGNIGAVMRIFGYMTEQQYNYHSQNPADGSAVTYYIESDYVAYDYNWYVLTSGVTFSAANMFASMAKELEIPVIGQKSSGGASSIGSFILPDGSGVMISTNNVLSTRVGNEVDGYDYESVESGIPVDIYINNVTNDTKILEAIEDIKNSEE
ncbi:MAG: S41 family peptidase [Bacillota bacterium]